MHGLSDDENVPDENNTRESNTGESNTDVTDSVSPPHGLDVDVSTSDHGRADQKFYVPHCGLVFYVMAFLAFFCTFGLRAGLSVAIVAMVNQTAVSEDDLTINTSDTDQCPRDPALQDGSGEFVWDRIEQGTVLAAFFYGRQLTQIPGGWLADRFGGKWLLGGCVLLSSVVSLLSPAAARTHLGFFVFLRVLSGLGEGVMFPALLALIARWSTPKYHSLAVSVIFLGIYAGIVVGMLVSGVLSELGFAGGWPSVFYVLGMVGCVWSAAWFLLCYDSPSVHPRMSSTEREYWRSALVLPSLEVRVPTPWRKILTSLPVWALGIAYFANIWSFYTLAICMPLFMYDVLGFDMTKNGIHSAVPFLGSAVVIPAGLLSDWLRAPGRLSTNVVRKIFCVSGFISTGCMLILTGYAGCDRALAVVLMFIAIGCTCLSLPVVAVNQLDLAPLHAGKIMGLTQFVANLSSIAAPHAVGFLTYHRSSRSEWQNVFFLAAAISGAGAIVFVVFGSGERQSWADATEFNNQQVIIID